MSRKSIEDKKWAGLLLNNTPMTALLSLNSVRVELGDPHELALRYGFLVEVFFVFFLVDFADL